MKSGESDVIIDIQALNEIADIYLRESYLRTVRKYHGTVDEGKIRILATFDAYSEYLARRLVKPNYEIGVPTRKVEVPNERSEV